MWMIILPLVFGYILAAWKPKLVKKLPVEAIANASLLLLLLVMGGRLGADPQVVAGLASLGGRALVFAGATTGGSLVAVFLLGRAFSSLGAGGRSSSSPAAAPPDLGQTLVMLAAVLAGFFLGLTVARGMLPFFTQAAVWVLGLLLLGVGLELGGASRAFAPLRQMGPVVVLVPLGIILGSILGGIGAARLLGLSWQEGGATASGFGWYSLSSVLITELHSPLLGALAFLANVFRELLAVLITPLVARRLGPVAAVAPGGATAMDVLLPIITRGAGREYAPLAFFSGALLSLAVPVFVNLFLSLI